jgi:hypothetical protein
MSTIFFCSNEESTNEVTSESKRILAKCAWLTTITVDGALTQLNCYPC